MSVARHMGIGLSVLALGCSPTSSRPAAPKMAGPATASAPANERTKPAFDIQAALNREAGGLTKHVIDAGAWQADVLAVSPPVVRKEKDLWTVSVDIGTEGKVQCFVYETLIDAGQTLGGVLKLVNSEKVQSQRVAVTDLKVIRETPVLFAEALYTAETPSGRAAGLFKVAVQAHETHPLTCLHDEMGYRQTFASVLESLATSLRGLPEPADAKFVEIARANLGTAVVGFSFGRLRRVPSGGSEWFEQSVQIVPRSATELLIADTAEVQKIDAAGTLTGGTWSEAEGGELASTVTLSRKPTGKYAYEGTFQSKPVAGEFDVKSKEGLASMISSTRLLAGAMQKKAPFELTAEVYVPSMDPTKPVQKRYKGNGSGDVAASIQDRTMMEKLSPDGHTESWELTVNGAKLVGRRVCTKGSL